MGETNGKVITCGRDEGNLLCSPTNVLIDKQTNSLLIAERGNRRIPRWSRRQGTIQGEVIVDNIGCWRLVIDHQRYAYVSDFVEHKVRRYAIGAKNGVVVADGNGEGNQLN